MEMPVSTFGQCVNYQGLLYGGVLVNLQPFILLGSECYKDPLKPKTVASTHYIQFLAVPSLKAMSRHLLNFNFVSVMTQKLWLLANNCVCC